VRNEQRIRIPLRYSGPAPTDRLQATASCPRKNLKKKNAGLTATSLSACAAAAMQKKGGSRTRTMSPATDDTAVFCHQGGG